jgi:hypothetical protein
MKLIFPHNFENQDVLQFQLSITKPEVAISMDYHGNRV